MERLNDLFAFLFDDILGYTDASEDFYFNDVYIYTGITLILVSLIMSVLYYFIINKPNHNSFVAWFIYALIAVLISISIGIFIGIYTLKGLDVFYSSQEYIFFSFKIAAWTIVMMIIWAYTLKWFSLNCKETPKLFLGKF